MDYLLITDNTITNIIVCDDDATAASFGAIPTYDGARIGDTYSPPPEPEPEPTLEERVTGLEDAIATGLNLYEGDLGNG